MACWLLIAIGSCCRAVAVAEPVDLELVLAADASGSIDDGEIRLQREGYAAAITSGEILQAIGVGYLGRIAVTYVEWGDQNSQVTVVPWRVIDGPESAAAFAPSSCAPRRAGLRPQRHRQRDRLRPAPDRGQRASRASGW